MMEKIIIKASEYSKIDGRNAYKSNINKITIGEARLEKNKNMEIALQIWEERTTNDLELTAELPIHQVFDLMIFLSSTLLYFKEAYKQPLLYNPDSPTIERIGVQGEAISLDICMESTNINEDIKNFALALNNLGEIAGERLRILTRIIKELECY